MPSVATYLTRDRQFHPKRSTSSDDFIEVAMSHVHTYRVMFFRRHPVEKRQPLRRTMLPVEPTVDTTTVTAIHDELKVREGAYLADDRRMEHSLDEYAPSGSETLSHSV